MEEFNTEKIMDHLRYKVGYVYVMYQDRLYQLGNNISDWLSTWNTLFQYGKFLLFPLKGHRTVVSDDECEDNYKDEFDRHTSIKLLTFDEFQLCTLYFADSVDMTKSIFRNNVLAEDKAYIIHDNCESAEYWEKKTQKREKHIQMLKTQFHERYKGQVDYFVRLIQREQASLDTEKKRLETNIKNCGEEWCK